MFDSEHSASLLPPRLLLILFFLLLGVTSSKKSESSVVSRWKGIHTFGKNFLQVNMRRWTESDFQFLVIISRWRTWRHFSQKRAAAWRVSIPTFYSMVPPRCQVNLEILTASMVLNSSWKQFSLAATSVTSALEVIFITRCAQTLSWFRRHLKTHYTSSQPTLTHSALPQCALILFWDLLTTYLNLRFALLCYVNSPVISEWLRQINK